jgi:MFS transporter, UMF1 family
MGNKKQKRIVNAWAFYDWANSVYPLVITTAIFPLYYTAVTSGNKEMVGDFEADVVYFFGIRFVNTALYSYITAASFLVVAFASPILSGVADYIGNKRFFLSLFCYIGSSACIGLFFFDPGFLEFSMLLPFFASIGYWGSMVFYNAYLPEIAPPEEHDNISARGFTMGYVGSVLLLVANLVAIQAFGMPAKWAFITVGIWWAGFAQITLIYLPDNPYNHQVKKKESLVKKGFLELQSVWKQLKNQIPLKRYLGAYFVYNMGVQTVMLMAILFSNKEIQWLINPETGQPDTAGLIIAVIIIQLLASVGAFVMSRLSKKVGNIMVLKVVVFLWILLCVFAYFIHTPTEFYLLAAFVGFVMGGIQSMSRSTYSKMLPQTEDHASYFSFYDVAEKVGIVLGTLAFGYIEDFTGSMRNSVLVLITFFVIGFILLQRVPKLKVLNPQETA